MIKLLIGGSPCTFWSIAQKNGRETEAKGLGWELFKNYLIAKEKFKPDFFLYENNKSVSQSIKDQISRELDVDLMYINSALVSAQNRQRFYAINWEVEQPEDRGISLRDILETSIDNDIEVFGVGYRGRLQNGKWVKQYEIRADDKSNALTTSATDSMVKCNGEIRHFTATEVHRLQTLPDGFCRSVARSRQRTLLGNGWTAEVIIHVLNGALKDVPLDEEIVVLSMYDGISTGRYCLDKMGFTNVKYFAYEIDKYAKQVAMSNYPDVIQMGDAFDLRHPDWTIGY